MDIGVFHWPTMFGFFGFLISVFSLALAIVFFLIWDALSYLNKKLVLITLGFLCLIDIACTVLNYFYK